MKIIRKSALMWYLTVLMGQVYGQNGVIFSEDFESGKLITEGREIRLSCYNSYYRFKVQKDITRYGNYAAWLENLVGEGKRCEMVIAGKTTDFRYDVEQERWVRFSFMIPYLHDNGYGIIAQHHSVPGYGDDGKLDWSVPSGANGFTLRVKKAMDDNGNAVPELWVHLIPPENLNYNKDYTVDYPNAGGAANGTKVYYKKIIELKKWYDVILHFRYSAGDDGFFQVWLNRELVVDIIGSNVMLHDTGGRLKGPWYYSTGGVYAGTDGYGASYYDEYLIGDETMTYNDMLIPVAPLSVPTALFVVDSTSSDITFKWTGSTKNVGTAGYDVFRDGVFIGTVMDTTFTDSLLTANTTYTYTVKARDMYGQNETTMSESLSVTTLKEQMITIAPIPDKLTKDPPFDVEATTDSGLELTYEILSGPATISGKTITLDGTPGKVVVKVTQAGNAEYGPASSTITFDVELITGLKEDFYNVNTYPIPVSDRLVIKGNYSKNARVKIINLMGKQVLFERLVGNQVSVANLPQGTYILIVADRGTDFKSKIIIQR